MNSHKTRAFTFQLLLIGLILGARDHVHAGRVKVASPFAEAVDSLRNEVGGLPVAWGKLDSVRVAAYSNSLNYSYTETSPGGQMNQVRQYVDPYASQFVVKTVWISVAYQKREYQISYSHRSQSSDAPELQAGDDIPVIFQGKVPAKILLRYRYYMGWRIEKDENSKAGYTLK